MQVPLGTTVGLHVSNTTLSWATVAKGLDPRSGGLDFSFQGLTSPTVEQMGWGTATSWGLPLTHFALHLARGIAL